MGVLRRAAAIAIVLAVGCGSEEPPFRAGPQSVCPERMAQVPGRRACIDRHEARIRSGEAVPATDALPSDGVTWFDAERACRRAGYRLCSIEEFERACGGADRERAYPYGREHVAGRCNVAEQGDDLSGRAIARSGAFPECRSPEGVFDLSGNVMEWLADEGGGGGLFAIRGGTAFQPSSSARCVPDDRGWLDPDESGGGFRCCTSLAER